ncbi:UTP--glucose-1-phosphate uridylyltransferase [Diplonema papillatum]|nr:UTP--glucose-1-phosphate uridylyltransferase [Diplonema papillatum]
MFISNSDNLGATMDPKILKWFEDSDYDFLMEVCERTEADKKGGHLAQKGDSLVLREAAQCADEDADDFQDVQKHKYFNTNNLWIRLTALLRKTTENKGKLTLPMIVNQKTVDPTDKNSDKVFQLETAMGAAIEIFGSKSAAIVVGRDRFAPVKTCNDLLAVRSDAFVVTDTHSITLAPERNGVPPTVSLGDQYKMVPALEELTSGYDAVPSLVGCDKLTVTGAAPLKFSAGTVFKETVAIDTGDNSGEPKTLPAGEYTGDVSDKLE